MLTQKTRSQNFSAVSVLDNGNGTGEVIMYMNAGIDDNRNVTFNEQIRNPDLYKKNKEMVDSDHLEFKAEVLKNI